MSKSRVTVDTSSIRRVQRNMSAFKGTVKQRANDRMGLAAGRAENYAKQNRPWTDRTGNARRSISAPLIDEPNVVGFYLLIGVHYGLYLELDHGGRFAIVWPTVTAQRQEFIRVLEGIVE